MPGVAGSGFESKASKVLIFYFWPLCANCRELEPCFIEKRCRFFWGVGSPGKTCLCIVIDMRYDLGHMRTESEPPLKGSHRCFKRQPSLFKGSHRWVSGAVTDLHAWHLRGNGIMNLDD